LRRQAPTDKKREHTASQKEDGKTYRQQVRSGGSYISSSDLRLHFGLASHAIMNEITVRWPNGQSEALRNLPADFIYTIREGQGVIGKVELPALRAASASK